MDCLATKSSTIGLKRSKQHLLVANTIPIKPLTQTDLTQYLLIKQEQSIYATQNPFWHTFQTYIANISNHASINAYYTNFFQLLNMSLTAIKSVQRCPFWHSLDPNWAAPFFAGFFQFTFPSITQNCKCGN